MKHSVIRGVLATLLGAVAVFDIGEGILVLTKGSLPDVPFQGTPFPDATIPMLLLAMIVGGSSLLAAAMVFSRHVRGVLLAAAAGLIMIVWEVAELVVIQRSSMLQPIFMYLGLVVIALAAYLWTTEFQAKPLPALKHNVIQTVLFVITAFIGVGAVQGGIALLQGALAQWVRPDWLIGTPFSDYMIPSLVLVIVVGGSALLAAATVFIDREWAVLVSALAGLLMAGYEVVEIVSVDSKVGNALLTALGLQLLYLVLGLVVFGLAGFLWMREYRPRHVHLGRISHA